MVRARTDTDEKIAAQGDHTRRREVDAGVHHDEHLAERGEREHCHVGEDERPGSLLQRLGGGDGGDDGKRPCRKPHGQEPGGDDRVCEKRATEGLHGPSYPGRDDGKGVAATRRSLFAGAAEGVNCGQTATASGRTRRPGWTNHGGADLQRFDHSHASAAR